MIFDIYTRVSDEGDREGPSFGSPEEQEAAARRWIEREPDGEVGEVVYDANVSGSLAAEERQLGELIRRVESGESHGIVVLYEDRFARDVIEGGRALQRIVAAGGRLIATATGFDSQNLNPQSQMLFNIMMAIGQATKERNRDNYLDGKQRAAARGVYCSRVPFGYDRDEDGRLVRNADTDAVREIFRLRADGVGFSEIQERLGLLTRGLPRQVVRNRAYLGEQRVPVRGRKGEPMVIAGGHPPVVTEAEWEAANAVHGRAPIRRGLKHLVKFKGLVKCGLCGASMSVNGYGKNRDKLTYVCTRRGCGGVAVAATTLEPALSAAVHAAVAANEPHVAATLTNDDRYEQALAAVSNAQQALTEYRDSVELQQALGVKDFAAGLRARREAVEVARRALRTTPRPSPARAAEQREFDPTNLSGEYAAYETALVHRVVAEVRAYPRSHRDRLTLKWHGAEAPVAVGTEPVAPNVERPASARERVRRPRPTARPVG